MDGGNPTSIKLYLMKSYQPRFGPRARILLDNVVLVSVFLKFLNNINIYFGIVFFYIEHQGFEMYICMHGSHSFI